MSAKRLESDSQSVSPIAKFGDPSKPVMFGDVAVPCYVLDDKRRVITLSGALSALGLTKWSPKGGGKLNRLALFSSGNAVRQHISEGVGNLLNNPVQFLLPKNGGVAHGFEAETFMDLCDAVIAASVAGSLKSTQAHIASRALTIIRAAARVGIVALIDEATGYQAHRDDGALQKILDLFLTKEQSKWAKRFPDEFYRQIFRLRGWEWKGRSTNCPQCVAAYTKILIYDRLAPGILKELEIVNPLIGDSRRSAAHHQYLTPDIGHPALSAVLQSVISLMKATDNWNHMVQMVNTVHPRKPHLATPSLFDRVV